MFKVLMCSDWEGIWLDSCRSMYLRSCMIAQGMLKKEPDRCRVNIDCGSFF